MSLNKPAIGGAAAVPAATRIAAVTALLLVALLFFLPGFFDAPPFDRDEARFAQASRQMLESGDFVNISFQDEPRLNKPIGIYWLQSAAAELIGGGPDAGIWAYRLPSLAGALCALGLTVWVGGALFGWSTGLLAAVMMMSSVLLGVEARMAKTDAVLLATVLLAQGALAHMYLAARDGRPPSPGMAAVFWGAIGAGILIKGPIVVLVSGGTLLALALSERRAAWMKALYPLRGLLIAALIVLPWLIAITVASKGGFWRESVGHDLFAKVASSQESHGAPPGTYLATFWLTFWPFALLTGLAIPWVWSHRREPAVRFCLAWLLPTWLMFEVVPTKLLHYTLPVYPAIALLSARAALAMIEENAWPRHWLARLWPLVPFALVGVALALLVPAGVWYLDGRLDPWAFAGSLGALAVVGVGIWFVRAGRMRALLAALPVCALALYAPVWQGVIPSIEALSLSPRIAAAVAALKPCPDTVLAAAGYTEPSLVFLTSRKTRLGSGGQAAEHLLERPACALAAVTKTERPAFETRLAKAGKAAQLLASLDGFNYSRGRRVSIGIYRLAP
jgi:4-amino-4-deoxy-L-arabinose transferase-like glycosyltransferase